MRLVRLRESSLPFLNELLQVRRHNRETDLVISEALMAIYAADAAITIGTRISAPSAVVLLLIAKIEVMLTC